MQAGQCAFDSIKAVLFDLDGTLVHSSLDFARIRREIACPEGVDLLGFVDSLEGLQKQQAQQIIHRHELEDAYCARIVKGAPELLTRLDDAGIKTGIITRNSVQATRIKLDTCGISITEVITREDAAPKPDPQALLRLSQAWAFESSACVYVGDYLYDLQAARNAGMHSCLFYGADVHKQALPDFAKLADFICVDFNYFETVLIKYLQTRA